MISIKNQLTSLKTSFETDRLFIAPIAISDKTFILKLVNTEGWLKFIGNRNVLSEVDAIAYIQKIIDNPSIAYFVVKLKNTQSIGIVSLIKRNYLENPDIGFAFLPEFAGNGYAYESTNSVLKNILQILDLSKIVATTIPENISSVKLLKKLGLSFEKEIEVDNNKIHVYGKSFI